MNKLIRTVVTVCFIATQFSPLISEAGIIPIGSNQTSASSVPADQLQDAQNSAQTNVDTKNALMSAATATIPAAQQDLINALIASPGQRYNLNSLFGTSFQATGPATAWDNDLVALVTSKPGYTQAGFLASLQLSADLYRALQADSAKREKFNQTHNTYLPQNGSPRLVDSEKLFDLTGAVGYNLADFLNALVTPANPIGDLTNALIISSAQRQNLNLLFGTSFQPTGPATAWDNDLLALVTSKPGYTQAGFLASLQLSADLYRALQADSDKIQKFNDFYKTYLPLNGSPIFADSQKLFDITGAADYTLTKFLLGLSNPPLVGTLRINRYTHLRNFNLIYGTSIQNSGTLSARDYGIVLSVITAPGYNEANFLSSLALIGNLYSRVNSGGIYSPYRNDFNLLYGTSFSATGAPSAADRETLYQVTSASGYNQINPLGSLTKTAVLYKGLLADAAKRTLFNTRYGTRLPAAGSPVAADRTVLFNLTGASNYNVTDFLNSLGDVANPPLVKALQANTYNYLQSFNLLYGTSIPFAGSISAADNAIVLSVTSAAGYNQHNFLVSVAFTGGLYRELKKSSYNRGNFNLLYGTSLSGTSAPGAVDRAVLFQIAGVPGFNRTGFLIYLGRAVNLHNALLANPVKRNLFNTKYGTQFTASESPSAADREKLFNLIKANNYNQTRFLNGLVP